MIEEDSDDEEILIWIDAANTPHPRLRNPLPTGEEGAKLPKSVSMPKASQGKDQECKSEDATFFSPETEGKKDAKAISESLKKRPDLLPAVAKTSEDEKKSCEEGLVKCGKYSDNTNASVQDNDGDKPGVLTKEAAGVDWNQEPINPVKLHIEGDLGESDVYRDWGLGFGDDNLSCNSENFMKNTEKNHETNDIRDLGLGDDNFQNNDLEMDFSDKLPEMEDEKAPEMDNFEGEYEMKPFDDKMEEFSHHSDLLNDGFMEPPAEELNYF